MKRNISIFLSLFVLVFTLISCNSEESELVKEMNEGLSRMTRSLIPVGEFEFDEDSPKTYPYAGTLDLKLDQLNKLQKKGVITLEVLEKNGSAYKVRLELTPKAIEEYFPSEPEEVLGTSFLFISCYNEKIKEIAIEDYGKGNGKCTYSTVYNEVTPFGEILKGIKKGELKVDGGNSWIERNEKGNWKLQTPML